MHKTKTTAIMLRIAKDYDRLAELTEIRMQAVAKKRQSKDRAEERLKASDRRQPVMILGGASGHCSSTRARRIVTDSATGASPHRQTRACAVEAIVGV